MSQFCVYKISSNTTNTVYYGYYEGEDVLQSFLKGAQRTSQTHVKRGAVDWLQENSNNVDNIQAEIVDVCGDEYDAWCYRNDYRARDCSSITGPSNWPANIAQRANKEQPERIKNWKHNKAINECKTARQAYQMGAWAFEQIKQLSPKDAVVKDLDRLTPESFCIKYGLTIAYK